MFISNSPHFWCIHLLLPTLWGLSVYYYRISLEHIFQNKPSVLPQVVSLRFMVMTEKGNSKTAIYSSQVAKSKASDLLFSVQVLRCLGRSTAKEKPITGSFLYLIIFQSANSKILQKYSLLFWKKILMI